MPLKKRAESILKKFSIRALLEAHAWLFKVAFYTGLIIGCYLAFSPVDNSFQAKFNDKLLHFIGFLAMSFSAQIAHPRTPFWILATGLILFGFLIELVQAYLPYRSFSWWDGAADALAVLIYFVFVARLVRHKSVLD